MYAPVLLPVSGQSFQLESEKAIKWFLVLILACLNRSVTGAYLNDAPVTDLLRQASIKTKNHFMDFSDSSWQYFPDTGRSTGAYIIFYQGGKIDHGTHVPGPVAQSSAESEYNSAYTTGMALAHIRMLIHEFLNKDPDIVP